MTETQGQELLTKVDALTAQLVAAQEVNVFFLQVMSWTLIFIAGGFTWKMWVYAKNQRDFY